MTVSNHSSTLAPPRARSRISSAFSFDTSNSAVSTPRPRIYREARALFDQVPRGAAYRLIGVGISDLTPGRDADLTADLLDPQAETRARAERATDAIRARFGKEAIIKGRALR